MQSCRLFWKSFSILKHNLVRVSSRNENGVSDAEMRDLENQDVRDPLQLCDTHFMCLTALDPTLSATNSTVRRSDNGWLWKKACSRSTCQHVIGLNPPWSHSPFHFSCRSRWLTCSFCCDPLAVGVSLSSAEVGVILRMIPPLLAVLPDTKAARSLRNSPAQTRMMHNLNLAGHLHHCGPL